MMIIYVNASMSNDDNDIGDDDTSKKDDNKPKQGIIRRIIMLGMI